jgi:hypothetical protein
MSKSLLTWNKLKNSLAFNDLTNKEFYILFKIQGNNLVMEINQLTT